MCLIIVSTLYHTDDLGAGLHCHSDADGRDRGGEGALLSILAGGQLHAGVRQVRDHEPVRAEGADLSHQTAAAQEQNGELIGMTTLYPTRIVRE